MAMDNLTDSIVFLHDCDNSTLFAVFLKYVNTELKYSMVFQSLKYQY